MGPTITIKWMAETLCERHGWSINQGSDLWWELIDLVARSQIEAAERELQGLEGEPQRTVDVAFSAEQFLRDDRLRAFSGQTHRLARWGLVSQSTRMPHPRKPDSPFRYFNSSPEVIRLVVMMYIRFPLSLCNVEDLLAERGIDICHETVRHWWNRFGPMFAADIRRQRVSRMRVYRQWKWHLDEMYVKLNGEMVYLWRAVDHEGEVLESFITKTRDKAAALTFMKKTFRRHGTVETITTDGLRSYRAAMTSLGCEGKQEIGRLANNRCENNNLPLRRRERAMLRFRRMKTLQKFASVHGSVHNHFNEERHLVDRKTYKERRSAALAEWQLLAS